MKSKVLKLYLISTTLGVLTGLIASLFQISIVQVNRFLTFLYAWVDQQEWPTALLSALMSMLMVLVAWLSVYFIAPEASGSGVPEIEGTLLHVRPIFWRRLIPVKFFSGILAICAKMVVGREGPTIQMGGNLGAMLGELFKLNSKLCDTLIAAGSAAGLAAAFNAPLAGVLFVMEEMRNQFNYSFTNFKMVVIACVVATITLNRCVGAAPAIQMQLFQFPSLSSLGLFLIFGVLVGLVGLAFNLGLMWVLEQFDKFKPRIKLIYVLLVGLLVGYLAHLYPPTVGGGYEIISQALTLSPSVSILFLLLVIRFFTTLMCYSTSVPGGIFAPMLALGTLLGLAVCQLFQWLSLNTTIEPGMFAVVGMGALFAATVRSPITGVVLVVEMTQNYLLILPLMVSCIASTTVMQLANNEPIYTQLLERTLRKSH